MRSRFSKLALVVFTFMYLTSCGGGGVPADVTSMSGASAAPATAGRWSPASSDTWQWQLRGRLNTSYAVKVYDIDLFDTPQTTIAQLQAQGKRVVCYFSAGSSEDWRLDFARFRASDMGAPLRGWAGERWLDTRSNNVREVMRDRLNEAKRKGCDGVEPDNVDAYANASGFPLDRSTQLDFNRFLASESHARGLAVALKNDVAQIPDLSGDFDFAINEQCFEFGECAAYTVFTTAGKAVFNAEYKLEYQQNIGGARNALCRSANVAHLRTLILPLQLDDSLRYTCD